MYPFLLEPAQLVLPTHCHAMVLRLAHSVPMSGQVGVAKTGDCVWIGSFGQRSTRVSKPTALLVPSVSAVLTIASIAGSSDPSSGD